MAASRAKPDTYGPRNTVPMVVLNAELAQSYMAQPKISRLSFTTTSVPVIDAITPPDSILEFYIKINPAVYAKLQNL
jgi:hypothetical protein